MEITLLDCGALNIILDQDLDPDEVIRLARRAGNLINKYRHPTPPAIGEFVPSAGGEFGFAPPAVHGPDPDATITCHRGS